MAYSRFQVLVVTCSLACGVTLGAQAARASETGPVIVIPGRAGVPVMMDGRDISYAVVEGAWGLDRPSQTDPVVIFRYGLPPPYHGPPAARYFPSGGPPPRLGRKEIDVPRAPPPQQHGTVQSWSAESAPTPATSPTPLDVPGMVVVPEVGRWRRP